VSTTVDPAQIVLDELALILPQYYDIGAKALGVWVGVLLLRKGWTEYQHYADGDKVRFFRVSESEKRAIAAKDREKRRKQMVKAHRESVRLERRAARAAKRA
jgi:hypothetical protein